MRLDTTYQTIMSYKQSVILRSLRRPKYLFLEIIHSIRSFRMTSKMKPFLGGVLFIFNFSFFIFNYLYCAQEIAIISDKVQFDKLHGKTIFSGNVEMKTGDLFLHCDEIEAYTKTRELMLKHLYFTTCNLENPHYKYYANKAHLIMNKRITATNVMLYLGDFPSAVLPYYYKSLKEKKYKIEIKPGYSNRDSFFAKGILGYPFSDYIYGKLYIDYFTYKGWGKGGEFLYGKKDEIKGTIYGYRIDEKNFQSIPGITKRWNARIYHWQNLGHNWFTQVNSNYASDESFNAYYTDDWIKIYGALESSISFTKNKEQTTTRISFSRFDEFNKTKNKYLQTSLAVPSVSFTTRQIKIRKLPLYYELNLRGARTWDKSFISTGAYTTSALGDIYFSNPLNLTRRISLTSSVGFTQIWRNRDEVTFIEKDVYLWKYRTNLNLNIRSTRSLNHQFIHEFEQQPHIRHDDYHGVLLNKLKTVQSVYLDNMTIRAFTALNIRRMLNEEIKSLRNRLEGITTEIDYSPNRSLNIYYKNDYNVVYRKPNSVQLDSYLKLKNDIYIRDGISYNRSKPGQLTLFTETGIRPTRHWEIAYKMQTSFNYDFYNFENFSNLRYYEKAIKIYRDLHCWEAAFSYLERIPIDQKENYYELWFNIRIKPGAVEKKEGYPENEARNWYPWRY